MNILELMKITAQRDASDLHISEGSPPLLRVDGQLVPASDAVISAQETEQMLFSLLLPEQKEMFRQHRSIDFSHSLDNSTRFRINAYYQKRAVTIAFRRLSDKIRTLAELGLPESLHQLSELRDGLVLVTGPTGCGKSTTLATLIDEINQTRACNIITIEDPIEYIHHHKKSLVNQRELYSDVDSFSQAIRSVLREDPDVILVGEMRDLDTIRTAITAAETGHLVFSTLHTRDTVSSIARILGVFPPVEQQHIRYQISESLKAVVSQRLLPAENGCGRVPTVEIMMVTKAIGNLIRIGKTEQIYSVIEIGSASGMQTMEQSLLTHVRTGKISVETAYKASKDPRLIKRRIPFRTCKLCGKQVPALENIKCCEE